MKLLDKILNEVSLDVRIPNGVFDIAENTHMDILREYLINKDIDEESAREFCNRVVEGKYPERQAYNAKGILVTFPTSEYKQRAIQRGTHFEKDPTKRAPNIFGGTEAPQQAAAPAGGSEDKQKQPTGKTSLPLSQAQLTEPSPEQPDQGRTEQPITTAAPAPTATSAAEEPPLEPTELPPPPEKSDAEKEADKNAIKKIMKGDDAVLESILTSELNPRVVSGLFQRLIERTEEPLRNQDAGVALRTLKEIKVWAESIIEKLV